MIELPEPGLQFEDAFVAQWRDGEGDQQGLIEAIDLAVAAGRLQLAARLVSILDQHVEIPPGSALERAQKASRFLLLRKPSPTDIAWEQFADTIREARRRKIWRIKQRMRDRHRKHGGDRGGPNRRGGRKRR